MLAKRKLQKAFKISSVCILSLASVQTTVLLFPLYLIVRTGNCYCDCCCVVLWPFILFKYISGESVQLPKRPCSCWPNQNIRHATWQKTRTISCKVLITKQHDKRKEKKGDETVHNNSSDCYSKAIYQMLCDN